VHGSMWLFVMLLEDALIAQPEITGEINRFHLIGQARDEVHRLPVREREKNALDAAQIFRVFDEVQLREAVEIAMNFADRFARLLVGCDEDELGVRVEQQDTEQLRAAVTGAAEDTDSEFR